MPCLSHPVLPPTVSSDAFRLGMRRLTAGVSLITTRLNGERFGLIATSVSSLSADPPSLLVCVNHSASCHDALRQAGGFTVNVLTTRHGDLCGQFSQAARRGERFQTGEWLSLQSGAPCLADALVTFDCRIEQVTDWATHGIFIATVTAIHMTETPAEPMIYFNSGFHRLGKDDV